MSPARPGVVSRWKTVLGGAALLVMLLGAAGCFLASGERVTFLPVDLEGNGEVSGRLVSADGSTVREIAVGQANAPIALEVRAEVERGELTVEILSPDGAPVLAATARYGRGGHGTGVVLSDEAGRLRYRIVAREAGNGGYSIRLRVTRIPVPTPSPTP